jgi:integral membrane protein (TIGR01906 family)
MSQTAIPQKNAALYKFLSWVVTLMTPVAIVLTAVRLLLNPFFLQIEYRTPNFPADRYGFSLQDRLYWSRFALDYLINDAGIEYLGDLRFSGNLPVYNERELSHMIDVKNVVQAALNVWLFSLTGLVLLGLWAWRGGWGALYRQGLGRGGWFTAIFVAATIFFVLISFGVFFVAFHNVFFKPGTWVFEWSDTLIRLFPERFWRDIFIYVGVFSLITGALTGFLMRKKSAKAQEPPVES